MINNEYAFEKCLQDLQNRGKKFHGYITYNDIAEVFSGRKLDATIEAVDRVYEFLTKDGIKVVDHIPESVALIGVNNIKQDNSSDGNKNDARTSLRRRRLIVDSTCDPFEDVRCCPEETLDSLLAFALEHNDTLLFRDVFELWDNFNLSINELYYLCEYIISKGIEIHGLISIFQYFSWEENGIEEVEIEGQDLFFDSVSISGQRALILSKFYSLFLYYV